MGLVPDAAQFAERFRGTYEDRHLAVPVRAILTHDHGILNHRNVAFVLAGSAVITCPEFSTGQACSFGFD